MRVRMRQYMSGTRDGHDWPAPGAEIDLPDDEGADLCRNGVAEPVAVPVPVERADAPPAEKRTPPGPLGRR
jgi:hypothetical protein